MILSYRDNRTRAFADGRFVRQFQTVARQLKVPANRITQIIQGKRAISGDTALRLGHWFGTSGQFWLNLQSAYDIRVAARESGAEIGRLPMRSAVARKHPR